jgi:hypothetical protein
MRAAWLKSIERVSRQLAKQDMNAPAQRSTPFYFQKLGDALDTVAIAFQRQKKAEGDAVSAFAYELAQFGLSFVLANSVSDDLEWEIGNINRHMSRPRSTRIINSLKLTPNSFYRKENSLIYLKLERRFRPPH